ncbi:ComEC/Rec2 family competence protein, partial [Patescibacteria group bacterium]|nr:ComEC/Rec2 family competence protein [Patescibacteria group bacterium]MBU1885215.1 ComEC/Rec2 family competence protein [Patescibacteria group bacterium]
RSTLIIVIFANIMQKLNLTQNYIENTNAEIISYQFLFMNNLQDCRVKTLEYSFFIPNCQNYQEGTYLEVIGRQPYVSDKEFFQLKRLEVQAVEVIEPGLNSGKYWCRKLVLFSYAVKRSLLEKIIPFLPFTHASLVSGMVFGGTASLTQELQDSFRITGLTHVVSASGYNVSVVASLILVILSKIFPRQVAGVLAIMMIWFYAIMAELVPPVVRAAIMITLNLFASQVFFKQNPVLKSLFLSVLLMLFFQPFYLFSLSFWLSTLATLGIILVLPLLESSQGLFSRLFTGQIQVVKNNKQPNIFTESLLVTTAAQSLTLPLVAMIFGEVSWLSFITNTVLLWLTPLITLLGLGLMILGAMMSAVPGLWSQVAPVLSVAVWLPSEMFLSGVQWFGHLEWGLIKLSLPWWAAGVWWGILGLIILRKNYARKVDLKHVARHID